ncbi:MAG: ImmA/IrrE family metallo-endopeptidase [Archangiaceae bacterium]|nr:ImmA/IrrE family metallo-endopeptidase [Archangiaceae bacterium]
MAEALVNPRLLFWARERAQLDAEAMAAALKVAPSKVGSWEQGDSHPSFTQAEAWARVTHVPFGVLFATEPPSESPLPPDFRTIEGRPHQPSPAFRDLYDDVLFKHAWYRDYRRKEGFAPVAFVGTLKPNVAPATVARAMRAVINPRRTGAATGDDFYRELIAATEQAGVWVMRSGTVAGNTSRAVKPDEFRGFAIADATAPLVFVNAADSAAAQLFTLAHELAHLWLGKTGVSDPLAPTTDNTERLCNAAAAEFLGPGDELGAIWRKSQDAESQFSALASHFKVSSAVIAIRAREQGLASRRIVDEWLEKQRTAWKRAPKKKGGGNYYLTLITRNGREFTRAVLSAALSQELFLRDAGQLLNVSPARVFEVARREGLTA